jgi:hypothetical protein
VITIGRFISEDPLGFPGGPDVNHYAYASDNPVSLIDPLGLDPGNGCVFLFFGCVASFFSGLAHAANTLLGAIEQTLVVLGGCAVGFAIIGTAGAGVGGAFGGIFGGLPGAVAGAALGITIGGAIGCVLGGVAAANEIKGLSPVS